MLQLPFLHLNNMKLRLSSKIVIQVQCEVFMELMKPVAFLLNISSSSIGTTHYSQRLFMNYWWNIWWDSEDVTFISSRTQTKSGCSNLSKESGTNMNNASLTMVTKNRIDNSIQPIAFLFFRLETNMKRIMLKFSANVISRFIDSLLIYMHSLERTMIKLKSFSNRQSGKRRWSSKSPRNTVICIAVLFPITTYRYYHFYLWFRE